MSDNDMGTGYGSTDIMMVDTLANHNTLLSHIPGTTNDAQNEAVVDTETGNQSYPRRARTTTDRFSFHAEVLQDEEETVPHAMSVPNASDWKAAIDAGIKALQDNGTRKPQVPFVTLL